MSVPSFFRSDARRTELAWTDWPAVHDFIAAQRVCRIAVNDERWPYIVAQTYRFAGDSFTLTFSRSGKLAAALARDPHCTIEIDEPLRFGAPEEPSSDTDYRSVIARCTATLEERELSGGSRILAARLAIVHLSAKRRPQD